MRSAQSLGGQARAIQQKEEARRRYEASPNICRNCSRPIQLKEQVTVANTRKKQFCDHSCSAQFNNRGTSRGPQLAPPPQLICKSCGADVPATRRKTGGYYRKKLCDPCLRKWRVENRGESPIGETTKGALFRRCKNWQSARSAIQKHARRVYKNSGAPMLCFLCMYNTHVDVAHRKPVSLFSDETLIRDINVLSNLAPLCPNHHWEYDAGLFVLLDR
jgi:hypothetical protein